MDYCSHEVNTQFGWTAYGFIHLINEKRLAKYTSDNLNISALRNSTDMFVLIINCGYPYIVAVRQLVAIYVRLQFPKPKE